MGPCGRGLGGGRVGAREAMMAKKRKPKRKATWEWWKPPSAKRRKLNERMPWPADYGRVEVRGASCLGPAR